MLSFNPFISALQLEYGFGIYNYLGRPGRGFGRGFLYPLDSWGASDAFPLWLFKAESCKDACISARWNPLVVSVFVLGNGVQMHRKHSNNEGVYV